MIGVPMIAGGARPRLRRLFRRAACGLPDPACFCGGDEVSSLPFSVAICASLAASCWRSDSSCESSDDAEAPLGCGGWRTPLGSRAAFSAGTCGCAEQRIGLCLRLGGSLCRARSHPAVV